MKRNDESKNRCPLRGLITILKTLGLWLIGGFLWLVYKIKNPTAFSGTIALMIALIVICGAERQTVAQKESKVISKTINIVSMSSTKEELRKLSKTSKIENAKTLKSNEEIAKEVMLGLWGNGDQRINRLVKAGYDPQAIQSIVDSKMPKRVNVTKETKTVTNTGKKGAVLTKQSGVCYNNPYGYKETWYSQRVLPGGGLRIPGRHVDSRGLVCDADGYICVAINVNDTRFPYGSIMETSLGLAKVYDHGCARGVIDVYVDW